MSTNNVIVAVYDSHDEAKQSVRELQDSGFDKKKMGIASSKGQEPASGPGLLTVGLPKESIPQYETALNAGKFLLLALATAEETAKTRDTVKASQPAQMYIHALHPAVDSAAAIASA